MMINASLKPPIDMVEPTDDTHFAASCLDAERGVPVMEPIMIQALSFVRTEVLKSIDPFLTNVKHTITIMSSIIAAALALLSFGLERHEYLDLAVNISAILLLMVVPISMISEKVAYRCYKNYVSNYIYSARLHRAIGAIPEHPWNTDLINSNYVKDINSDSAVIDFIRCAQGEKHSWYYYHKIIMGFGLMSGIAGILIPIIYWAYL